MSANKQPSAIVSHAMRGLVVVAKTPKTVTVLIEKVKMHPIYKKAIKRSKRYLVHDELGVKEGDLVTIIQCRPISANKRFKIQNKVGQDMTSMLTEELKQEAAEAIAEVLPEEKQEPDVENLESVVKIVEESKEKKMDKKPKRNKKEKA